MDEWVSGLNQRFTKPPSPKKDREFESHLIRLGKISKIDLYYFDNKRRSLNRFERRSARSGSEVR